MLQNKFENQNHLTCTDFQQRVFFQAAVERNKMLSTMFFDTESRICFVNSVLKSLVRQREIKTPAPCSKQFVVHFFVAKKRIHVHKMLLICSAILFLQCIILHFLKQCAFYEINQIFISDFVS